MIRKLALSIAAAAAVCSGALACRGRETAAAAATSATPSAALVTPAAESSFARLVRQLSESGGFFDSDNIISNETSYLHVINGLRRLGVHGGVYVGVGPDQNFSYVAAIRPSIAFMLDIRRDNLFEHLLFKALFSMSRNRVEYLCLLFGKPVPHDVAAWRNRSIDDAIAYLDSTRTDSGVVRATQRTVNAKIAAYGLALSETDLQVADRYRAQFVAEGLDVRFSSLNRNNRSSYPDLRSLILETDRSGRRASFLASDEAFQYVKSMQDRDLIVPVVGDVAGEKAVRAIANYAAAHGLTISAFYISNVEQYLMRDGLFSRYAENLKLLPRDARSVIIRSYFGRFGGHPLTVPGHISTSMLQTFDMFVTEYNAGNIRTYLDLVERGYVSP